jgi:hypothetical protein
MQFVSLHLSVADVYLAVDYFQISIYFYHNSLLLNATHFRRRTYVEEEYSSKKILNVRTILKNCKFEETISRDTDIHFCSVMINKYLFM